MNAEQAEVLGWFTHMLTAATADGGRKRAAGLKPSWKVDPSHEAAIFSHLNKWKHGEKADEDNGGHPLVSMAWRALAQAWQETHEGTQETEDYEEYPNIRLLDNWLDNPMQVGQVEGSAPHPRVFVAAPWPTRDKAHMIMGWLEEAGAVVTYDWTENEVDMSSPTASEELGVLAQKDLDGVLSADYLLVMPDTLPGNCRGTWAEVGLALGRGIPVLLWTPTGYTPLEVGCIYALHPAVTVVSGWDCVLEKLGLPTNYGC